ncbi:MAG: gliding motility-associated C-terminal domain-containing protein [Candidatus Saccharibacteria bacterium]
MTKNNLLLLIFPKRALFIFIFSILVVLFITIVSKRTFAYGSSLPVTSKEFIPAEQDTTHLFQEGFESQNLSVWKQHSDWEVSSVDKISGNFSLKHVSKTEGGVSSLFHTLKTNWNSSDIDWTFKIKNGNWDPSSTNRFWFYLSADTIQPTLINGWAVGVNISGNSDLLELWRIRKGRADTMVIQTDFDWNASSMATIHVKRSSTGNWELWYRKAGETVSPVFTGIDRTTARFQNIGLYFNYTYTRSGQLWIDDICVNAIQAGLCIQKLLVTNSHTLLLTFNNPMDISSVGNDHFQLNDENNVKVTILQINPVDASSQTLELQLGEVKGTQLTLAVSGIKDRMGNIMTPESKSFAFSYSPEPGSVLINEVLFNPLTNGADFVELVNVSNVAVDIQHLKLASRNDTLALRQIYSLSSAARYIYPAHYLTCTKDSMAVAQFYQTIDKQTFCSMTSFPTYPDDEGTVVLLNDSLTVIDEFSYTAKMHSPFLSSVNGVSLERISLSKPTSERSNWASATSTVGYATPGLQNSQVTANTEPPENITPEPVVFSPNGDGYNDQMTIHFNLSKSGYVANVRIFDIAGRVVKYLVNNESLASQGSWIWKGDSDSGQKLNLGVYIILVELYDPEGHTKTFKKTCTVSDRLH